jgi:hypothetical protein
MSEIYPQSNGGLVCAPHLPGLRLPAHTRPSKDSRVTGLLLILQFPLLAQTATAVACLGHLLVPAPPTGPEDDPRWRMLRRPHEAYQEPPDFRDGEGEVLWTGQRPLRPMLPALPGPG